MLAVLDSLTSTPSFARRTNGDEGWRPWERDHSTITTAMPLEMLAKACDIELVEDGPDERLTSALRENGWDPENPPPLKRGYYADPKELYYRTVRIAMCENNIDAAGMDGWRFIEIVTQMAQGFLGRIGFRDNGQLSNMAEDLVQEAITKCCLAVKSFNPWDKRRPGKCNNAFGYFTSVIRNKMYETLRSPLKQQSLYLEDLCTENQTVSDLF